MKRATAAAAALLALAGCISAPEGGTGSRKLTYGLFYEFFRPESSRQAEVRAKLDRPVAPDIEESYDISQIRAARTYSEVAEDFELRDWKDGVLLKADAHLLHLMRDRSAARVATLEAQLAGWNRQAPTLRKGHIEPVRRDLDVEKTKLVAIDERLARLE
jgi:hypothetical protein